MQLQPVLPGHRTGPEEPVPSDYPVALNSSVPVGSDPLFAELKSTYGNCDMYQPMWIMDTDNRYGFGQQEDGTSTPSWVNSYQRGPEESVWDTIPQPDWDTFKYGGPNGFLDLFNNGGGSFAQQYKYTDAPDADARMVQAAYWADTYAKAQGKQSQIATTLADAAKLGDYLRYSMFDKYFKQISANCSQQGSVACPAGTSKANEDTYLLSWYDAWGGATNGAWSWRISGTTIHEGYQNPLAAYALSTDSDLIPLSPTAKGDWATSLITQLNMYKWLQSAEGGIAGGIENNWGGNYGDVSKPPSGDPTFDGMYYDPQPEYHNPPSNQWFGYQTWPMERLAEYYYVTGNSEAQSVLAKWVAWAESVTTVNTSAGTFCLPGTLTWTGQPDESWTTGTSNATAAPGQHRPARVACPAAPRTSAWPPRWPRSTSTTRPSPATRPRRPTRRTSWTSSTRTSPTRSATPRPRCGPTTRTSPRPTTRPTTRACTSRRTGPASTPAASRSARPPTPSCRSAPGTSATRSGPRSRPT